MVNSKVFTWSGAIYTVDDLYLQEGWIYGLSDNPYFAREGNF